MSQDFHRGRRELRAAGAAPAADHAFAADEKAADRASSLRITVARRSWGWTRAATRACRRGWGGEVVESAFAKVNAASKKRFAWAVVTNPDDAGERLERQRRRARERGYESKEVDAAEGESHP